MAVPVAWAAQPPFVGCPADGQGGPNPPPSAPPNPVPEVAPAVADHLAFYGSVGLSVLAPRGWHCIELYGSGGAVLLVTPQAYTVNTVPAFGTLTGPAIELLFLNGENSGRGDVARVYARLFPPARDFVREVVAMGFEPASAFPNGPFPTDTTVRRSPSQVAYTTPAGRTGMGTFDSRLRPGPAPINGVAVLAPPPRLGVMLLNVRLPRGLRALTVPILAAGRARPP